MTDLTELRSADAYCRHLATRHYENFAVASFLLPRPLRVHLARIYAFCRTTDDFGDESGGDGIARLERWHDEVVSCFNGDRYPIHPVLIALKETIRAVDMPPQPFLDLIAANVRDQTVSAYETWEELKGYCVLSAAPVGRMVLRVFGVNHPRAECLSDDVCIGLQLANFAQDVRIDRAKGRTYLIQQDLSTHGLPGAVRALCDRAASLLQSGEELETMVNGRLRLQLALYRLGGLAIVAAIRRMNYRTDEQRPHVSAATKAQLVPLALLQSRERGRHVATRHAV